MVRDELGRRRLMQWDINQRLIVDVPAGTQIHYASEAIGDKALVTIAYEENGLIYSNIPNILLQSPGTITVYVYPIKGEEAHTKSCATGIVAHIKTLKKRIDANGEGVQCLLRAEIKGE